MKVKDATTYRRRYVARGERMAPKTRIRDYEFTETAWNHGQFNSRPNHEERAIDIAGCFPMVKGEEEWLI